MKKRFKIEMEVEVEFPEKASMWDIQSFMEYRLGYTWACDVADEEVYEAMDYDVEEFDMEEID